LSILSQHYFFNNIAKIFRLPPIFLSFYRDYHAETNLIGALFGGKASTVGASAIHGRHPVRAATHHFINSGSRACGIGLSTCRIGDTNHNTIRKHCRAYHIIPSHWANNFPVSEWLRESWCLNFGRYYRVLIATHIIIIQKFGKFGRSIRRQSGNIGKETTGSGTVRSLISILYFFRFNQHK
jgi:hypothetical protein